MSYPCRSTPFVFKDIIGYRTLVRSANTDQLVQNHPKVLERLKIITFFNKYGYQNHQGRLFRWQIHCLSLEKTPVGKRTFWSYQLIKKA